MRILYFHQYFGTPQGAWGTRSYEMARRLVQCGHDVTVVCGTTDRSDTGLTGPFRGGRRRGKVDGIDVIEIAVPYSNNNSLAQRTASFLRFAFLTSVIGLRGNYDLVFATTTPLTVGIPGILAKWLRGRTFVFEVRDLWPELPRAMGLITNPMVLRLMAFLEWLSYRSADRLIGLSPGIVQGIRRRGVAPSRIALIPNGCDVGMFSGNATPWRPTDVASTDLMAIFSGAHGVANGLESVLDAAVELKHRGRSDIKMVLVGSGAEKPKLQKRAELQKLDSIVFHDALSKKELSGLLVQSDLGMQLLANVPSFYYGTSPNKFFDYLAAGLPVLVNYPGWMTDIVRKHGCGIGIEPDNPQAFADTLVWATENRGILREMGQRARLLAHGEFNRDKLGRRFVSWLETGKQSVEDHVAHA